MKVLIDTNFLLACVKKKVHVFEYLGENFSEILIPRGVIDELVRIAQDGGPRDRVSAEVALKLMPISEAKILPLPGYVDQQIIDYVYERRGIVVATLDRKLQRVLSSKAKLLLLRNKKFIVQ